MNSPSSYPQNSAPSLFSFCATALSSVLLAGVSTAHAATAGPETGTQDQAIILSPFEVATDRDEGFVAASALAGGRLATDLKDTPVAYSVMTREFIDALGLTNLEEMAQWMPNNAEQSESGNLEWSRNDFYLSSRGVRANSPQRDFFPYGFNFDSYNVERLDFGRGPNSILFGNSGYGGTANIVSKHARTDRRFTEVQATYGSWSNFRTTLDHNQPLGDRFALRLNALYHERDGWQDRAFEKKRAGTLAASWRPFRQTEIRVEGERGTKDKGVAASNFDDFISAWNGVNTYDAPIARAVAAAGVNRQGTRTTVFTPSSGGSTAVNYQGWARTEGGNLNSSYPAGGILVVGPSANIRNTPIIERQNLPANLFDLAVAGSNFRVPSREFTTTVDAPLYSEEYYNYTLSLTQQLGERFFAEIAGNVAALDKRGDIITSRGLTQVFIDVNRVLPTGEPNPNFLEPYSESRSYPHYRSGRARNGRIALGYVSDDTRMGAFRFNIIAGSSRSDDDLDTYTYVLKTHSDPRQWPSYQQVRFRYYLNTDASRPYDLSDRTWTYIDPITNTTKEVEGGLVRDYTNATYNATSGTDYEYVQAAGSAKLLKGRLNLLAAVRRDRYETSNRVAVNRYDNAAKWDGRSLIFKPDAPADWASLTYRQRDASGAPFGPELPAEIRPRVSGFADSRYAGDRFQDDYNTPPVKGTLDTFSAGGVFHVTDQISILGNLAESFVPPLARFDVSGKLIEARTAEGWDYGVRVGFLGGRLNASVIRYEGTDEGNIISGSTFRSALVAIIQANPVGDLSPGGLNARDVPLPPSGTLDTVKSEISGWEFELTANIGRNWRVTANGALADGYQTDTYPKMRAYLAANDSVLRQIVQDAGGTYSGDTAIYNTSIPVSDSPEGPGAVDGWNRIQAELASISDTKQKLNRLTEATGNMFADHTFREGRLSGLRIGAGFNYRGRQVIGYRGADTIRDPADPSKAIDDPSVDARTPVYQPGYFTGVMTLSYSRKLTAKLGLEMGLRVTNLFDYDEPVYYSTILRPAGGDLSSPARVTTPRNFFWITPRSYSLSATLRF